jgi:hypothetical protein
MRYWLPAEAKYNISHQIVEEQHLHAYVFAFLGIFVYTQEAQALIVGRIQPLAAAGLT